MYSAMFVCRALSVTMPYVFLPSFMEILPLW
jgi:hypothetical protein